MTEDIVPTKISAALTTTVGEAVVQLQKRGYTPSEIVRRGIRLIAKEEGIPLGGDA